MRRWDSRREAQGTLTRTVTARKRGLGRRTDSTSHTWISERRRDVWRLSPSSSQVCLLAFHPASSASSKPEVLKSLGFLFSRASSARVSMPPRYHLRLFATQGGSRQVSLTPPLPSHQPQAALYPPLDPVPSLNHPLPAPSRPAFPARCLGRKTSASESAIGPQAPSGPGLHPRPVSPPPPGARTLLCFSPEHR